MPKDKYDENQQNPLQIEVGSKLYWGLLIVGGVVLILLAWWLMISVGTKVHALRDGFFPIIKRIAIISLVMVIGVSIFVFLVNMFGKQEEYNKNLPEKDTQKAVKKITKKNKSTAKSSSK